MLAINRRLWIRDLLLLAAGAARPSIGRADGTLSTQTQTQQRAVGRFDSVSWDGIGLLLIEQRGEESLSVTAEARILPKILSEVRHGRLHIGLAAGPLQTQQ